MDKNELRSFLLIMAKYTKLLIHHNSIDKTDIYFINAKECTKEEYEAVDKCIETIKAYQKSKEKS